jgi:hypothetical protein
MAFGVEYLSHSKFENQQSAETNTNKKPPQDEA